MSKIIVYASHRLGLSIQHVRNTMQYLFAHSKREDDVANTTQFVLINTAKIDKNEFDDFYRAKDVLPKDVTNTTSHEEIIQHINTCQLRNHDLIMFSTYHSIGQIGDALAKEKCVRNEVDLIVCDEGHLIVSNDNFYENLNNVPYKAIRFFTATPLKMSDNTDRGMNNEDFYGSLIYQGIPRILIELGEILPPRLHICNITLKNKEGKFVNQYEKIAYIVFEVFKEHKKMMASNQIAPKIIFRLNSREQLRCVFEHLGEMGFPKENIMAISSKDKGDDDDLIVYNGKQFGYTQSTRNAFFRYLQNIKDDQPAIIMHINTLSEGIDCPGITGSCMFSGLSNPVIIVQHIGRTVRLNDIDRKKLYSGEIQPHETDKFIKPCGWVIVPIVDDDLEFNSSQVEDVSELIKCIRHEYDYDPLHDYYASQSMPDDAKDNSETNIDRETNEQNKGEFDKIVHCVNHDNMIDATENVCRNCKELDLVLIYAKALLERMSI